MPATRHSGPRASAAVLLLALSLSAPSLPAQVPFLSELHDAPAKSEATLTDDLAVLASAGERVLVEFGLAVTPAERELLADAGLELGAYLSGQAYFARLAAGADATRILAVTALTNVEAIRVEWKLHPMLLNAMPPPYSVVAGGDTEDPTVAAYALFHRDVPWGVAQSATARHGVRIVDVLESVHGMVIELPLSEVAPLAAEDAVLWLEPPLPPLGDVNDSNRIVSQANAAQSPPYGLDGTGVVVLIFDSGDALASHQDFGGRLTVRDSDSLSDHSTHVAGTVGGDGSASGGSFRGMAPGVTLESYGFSTDGTGIFLYSNPGDIEQDYQDAILNHGAIISNNSIGTNTATNGFPCDITGDYGVTASLIDTIVTGGLGAPMRIVWANGNERQSTNCGNLYYTTAPPACAKNHITVGALNSNDDSMTSFSSWGPTDDGRIKPDVSAPGCQSNDDGGVTSTSSSGGYSVKCGTSMASPTVCGLSALLIEDFRNQFPGSADPLNSTLKMMLAHGAEDRGNSGPDHQFGYGSVRITDSIDFMRTGGFFESSVAQDGSVEFQIPVSLGAPELTVTLAWDDAPATPNVLVALVNDLDLIVTSPTGTQAFPWTLDPANPGNPALQNQANTLDNIEQVHVANPEVGTWTVSVVGTSVPEGPQIFSVGASPAMSAITLSLPDGAPELVAPGAPTTFPVLVRAINDTLVGTPQLHYRFGPGPFQSTPLTFIAGEEYEATLPGASCTETPEFYISAEGVNAGTVTSPGDAPATLYAATVGELVTVFNDDLESDLGWTVGGAGDDATTGVWVRVDPNGTAAQPENDHTPDPAVTCYVTGQGTVGGSLGENDVDGGQTTLLTPIFDLSAGDATISYWRWYSNNTGAEPNSDIFVVDISTDGGGSWSNVETLGPSGPGTGGGWIFHSFDVTDFVTPTSQMQVRFIASDEGLGSVVEAAIDDFRIERFECACATELFIRGDTNGDGTINLSDATFLLDFLFAGGAAPDPEAAGDVNDDGSTGLADVLYILNYLFVQGPPPPAPFPDPGCEG